MWSEAIKDPQWWVYAIISFGQSTIMLAESRAVKGSARAISKQTVNNNTRRIRLKVSPGKQNGHILGTNKYNLNLSQGVHKSILTEDAQTLLDEFVNGKCKIIDVDVTRKSIKVDFGKEIGRLIDRDTGADLGPTNFRAIKYGKKPHIVPVN
jgi:hypothetical protein